jgi:hypothetical protein
MAACSKPTVKSKAPENPQGLIDCLALARNSQLLAFIRYNRGNLVDIVPDLFCRAVIQSLVAYVGTADRDLYLLFRLFLSLLN